MKAPPDTSVYAFGPFRVEPEANRLTRDGSVLLTGKPVETLVALLEHRNRPVEKDELLKLVWRDTFVSEDSLTHSISALRKALGDDSAQPQYIATIPRRGYRFIARLDGAPARRLEPEPIDQPPTAATTGSRRWVPVAVIAASAMLVALLARGGETPSAMPAARAIRFQQAAPAGTALASGGVLSPDGRFLAFVARGLNDGRHRLWIRALDAEDARPLAGTEGAFRPFWSPDSQSIAFFANGRLKRVGLSGSAVLTVASVGYRPSGGAWSSNGIMLYSDRLSPVYLVAESGGAPAQTLTTLDPSKNEVAHHVLQFLPDGRRFLFFVESPDPTHRGTYLGTLGSDKHVRVLDADATAVTFAPPAHLLFVRERVLMAQRFDPGAGHLIGSPAPLREDVSTATERLSAAPGIVSFGGDTTSRHLRWFDRSGRPLGPLETPVDLHNPVLSPDGRQLLADGGGVWLVDLTRGAPVRIAEGSLPLWSPDGRSVLFTGRRSPASPSIVMRPTSDRSIDEQTLIGGNHMKLSGHWSADGHHFVYVTSDPETRLDIWWLTKDGSNAPRAFLETPGNEMQPAISPDGRWLAYTSDETGRWEVYVEAFPHGGGKRAISTSGGVEPQWTQGGRELVYLTLDGVVTAVEITTGGELDVGPARGLFRAPVDSEVTRYRNRYAVTRDGQRFLVDVADESTRDPINVIVNWEALLER